MLAIEKKKHRTGFPPRAGISFYGETPVFNQPCFDGGARLLGPIWPPQIMGHEVMKRSTWDDSSGAHLMVYLGGPNLLYS